MRRYRTIRSDDIDDASAPRRRMTNTSSARRAGKITFFDGAHSSAAAPYRANTDIKDGLLSAKYSAIEPLHIHMDTYAQMRVGGIYGGRYHDDARYACMPVSFITLTERSSPIYNINTPALA